MGQPLEASELDEWLGEVTVGDWDVETFGYIAIYEGFRRVGASGCDIA